MPDKLLKADRTRLIRRLGGKAALPGNAAELIDEALHGAAILEGLPGARARADAEAAG